MLDILSNAAMWASLAALLAAVGVEIPQQLVHHILEALAALAGIIGFFTSWRGSSHGS